jgi:hypothetical protein
MVSGAVDGEEQAGAAAFWVDGEGFSDFGVVEQQSSPSVVEKHSASPPRKDQYKLKTRKYGSCNPTL